MKYVFFGTPRFAEIVLQELITADLPSIAIVANPDRPVGRKKIITPPPTKILAETQPHPITILQPEKLDPAFIEKIRSFTPDFFVVAAYAKIIPQSVLDIPRLGTLGVHPSLLPKYRGASPIQSAILDGASETGVSIYLLDDKTDHGPILAKRSMAMENPTYMELEENLGKIGGELLLQVIPALLNGTEMRNAQDEAHATFTKKFKTDDGYIAPGALASARNGNQEHAITILRKIRAFNPEPGAWTIENNQRVKLLEATIKQSTLILTTIQIEGEKPKKVI